MIRTKSYIDREISRLKKRKSRLTKELEVLKSYGRISVELKKSMILVTKEIESIASKIEALQWCANTREKDLPKIKKKKKKPKKSEEAKDDQNNKNNKV